jgi:hypothetical protein
MAHDKELMLKFANDIVPDLVLAGILHRIHQGIGQSYHFIHARGCSGKCTETTKPFSISNSPTENKYIEFTKRITSSEYSKTLNNIKKEFLMIGLEVQEDSFQWEEKSYKNIVAEKKGVAFPHRVFILGAHYDTVPNSPGADDNASAIAVLLEVARHIQKISLGSTLKLIALVSKNMDMWVASAMRREREERKKRYAA